MTLPRTIHLSLERADGFLARARGLLWRAPLEPECGLLLPSTRMVHGFGMTRPLDLLFLDADDRVIDIRCLRPCRVRASRRAKAVIELEAGEPARLGIRPGDRICDACVDGHSASRRWHERRTGPTVLLAASVMMILAGSPDTVAAAGPDGRSGAAGPGQATPTSLPPAWIERFAARAESLYRAGADEEALAAFSTLLHVDPGALAVVSLRIGNLHQRNGRDWQAIDNYRRALDLDPAAGDAREQEARRKALSNLAALLEAVSRRVSDALQSSPQVPRVAGPAQAAGLPQGLALPPSSGSTVLQPLPLPRATSALPPAVVGAPAVVAGPAAVPIPASAVSDEGQQIPPRPRASPASAGSGAVPSSPELRPGSRPGGSVSEPSLPRVEYLGGR